MVFLKNVFRRLLTPRFKPDAKALPPHVPGQTVLGSYSVCNVGDIVQVDVPGEHPRAGTCHGRLFIVSRTYDDASVDAYVVDADMHGYVSYFFAIPRENFFVTGGRAAQIIDLDAMKEGSENYKIKAEGWVHIPATHGRWKPRSTRLDRLQKTL